VDFLLEEGFCMEFVLPNTWALVIAGGFAVGFLVGMTGVGAGSLTTPFLITQIGVNPLVAVGTDLLFACITKSTAAWRHHKLQNVDWRIVGWLAAGSLPAAAAVAASIAYSTTNPELLAMFVRRALAVLLVVSAVAVAIFPLLANRRTTALVDSEQALTTVVRPVPTLTLGLLLGTVVALTSVGAGAVGVVVLTSLYRALAMRRLVGTDIVHAIPLTLVAGLAHMQLGNVDFGLLTTLLVGSIPGIALGSRLTASLPDWTLRLILAAVLVIAAVTLIMK
jgi:uncharacterized protein